MRFCFYLICLLLLSFRIFGQQSTFSKDPTVALENFDFKAIDYASLDSTSHDFIKSIEYSLYHRFDEAEALLKKVALQTDSPLSKVARHYLLAELYFWREKYADYVQFSNQINEQPEMYDLAKSLAIHPIAQISFSVDSLSVPVTIKKHSYIIANLFLNGKPARLILDSGANFSTISQSLSEDLGLQPLTTINFLNSVGTTIKAPVGRLDSLSIGNVQFKGVPVIYTAKSKFFKRLHVDGLLGWDILSKLSYTTDFKAQTLMIRKPVLDTTAEKNLFGIGHPILVVRSPSGQPINMYFDSGSNSVDLMTHGVTKLVDYKTTKRPGMISGIGKTKIGWFRYVKNFTFKVNQKQLNYRRAYLSPLNDFILSIKRDGTLSNAPFKKGKLTIDYRNNHFDYKE
ncbi:retropepsin-like aspartic protease [Spirosoma foliorum]|uniref:Retropepsin-like domain-containing protein n=1 Tax=Spirosoma foliorum TaxID=2710596 RepID=A0A7G5GQT3_9BACT|nr:retropepsin-like aspartic protease [Spirosoma foliorum]QMW01225.1 retropepsin-like domain-containing protein [Spirosoma foliorum]